MMYSAYKLNKQGDNIQLWRTPFPVWNQSVFPCPVLTVASGPAYRFLKRQVRWSGIPIFFTIFHSLLWSTQFMGSQIVRHDWATFTFTFLCIVSWSLNHWTTREVSTALSLRWLILSLLYLVCCWTLLLFVSSVIVCFSSVASIWQFLIFSISLLKFSLCSTICLPKLVSIFIIIILNSSSDRPLIFPFLQWQFPFCLKISLQTPVCWLLLVY